ncbi:MAG: DUF1569 domain-containing protein [Bacteroidota bacterium]|mgnify:CR=1 FL=1
MKSLFEIDGHTEVIERIEKLNESTNAEWGKMKLGQMLYHCQFPLNLALGNYKMKKPNPVMKLLYQSFKKSMYNDKLWKQGLPTPKPFKVILEKEFSSEKKKLISLVNEFHQQRDRTAWEPHPAFGTFTTKQWGQMQYKHLDHHLRQFGV